MQIPSLQSQVPQAPTRVPSQELKNVTETHLAEFAGQGSLVFKARIPERLEVDLIPESTLIGKKRAAHHDFEGVENTPAHAFLADGKDAENRTPRVRRVLSSLHSSFTPNRNSNRPPAPQPSPKRPDLPLGTAHMYDMTNSPFSVLPIEMSSTKPSRRSWLGKIRGASQTVGDSNARHFIG